MTSVQKERLQEIIALSDANPNLDICFEIDHDDPSEHNWSFAKVKSVGIKPWYADGDYILTDKEEILDYLDEQIEEEDDDKREKKIQRLYKKNVKNVICVKMEPVSAY